MTAIRNWLMPAEPTAWHYAARLMLVAGEFVLAYCFAGQTNPFFYQAF